MGYRRQHIRIPMTGSAVLVNRHNRRVPTKVVNISEGGIGVTGWPLSLEYSKYLVILKTKDDKSIRFMGSVMYQNNRTTGLKMVTIDKTNRRAIRQLISEFQASEEFIQQIDGDGILTDWFVDENGDELDFNFEKPH